MKESSGMAFCKPAPFGSSFNLIVKLLVEMDTTSYSLNSSTGVVAPASEKNEIRSPTLKAKPAESASSTATMLQLQLQGQQLDYLYPNFVRMM